MAPCLSDCGNRFARTSSHHDTADQAVDYSEGLAVKGLKPAKSAAREAYEEAGIRGAISAKPIGAFSYDKRLEENGFTVPCEVRVFAMSVRRQLKSWPRPMSETQGGSNLSMPLRAQRRGLRDLIAVFVERTTGRPCR